MHNRHRVYPPVLLRSRELRHPQTPAEATLWRHLRGRNLVYKFRRQHPLDRFIVDFYCPEAKLCIEIDGGSHFETEQEEYDKIAPHPTLYPFGHTSPLGRGSKTKAPFSLPGKRVGDEGKKEQI